MCHLVHNCHSSRTHSKSAEAVHPHLKAQILTFHHWQEGVASAARHLRGQPSQNYGMNSAGSVIVYHPQHPLHMHCGCRHCERCVCPSKWLSGIKQTFCSTDSVLPHRLP